MPIKPLGDKVLVKRKEAKDVVRGGIIIPETAKEKPMEADVISIGVGKMTTDGNLIPFDVKAGDTVLIGKYAGQDIKHDNEDYIIVRCEDILGIVE